MISEREGSDHHQSESKPKQELTRKAQFIIAKRKRKEREKNYDKNLNWTEINKDQLITKLIS